MARKHTRCGNIFLAASLACVLLSCRDKREHTIIVRPDTALEKRDDYAAERERARKAETEHLAKSTPKEEEAAPKILYVNAPGYIYGRAAPEEDSGEVVWLGHKRKVYYIRSEGDWILFTLEAHSTYEVWLKKEYLVASLDDIKPNEELMRQLCGRYNFTRMDLIRGEEGDREDLDALEKVLEKAYITVSYDGGEKFSYYDHQASGIVNRRNIYVPNNIQDSFYDANADGSAPSFRERRYFTETGIRIRQDYDYGPLIREYIYTRVSS